MKSKTEYTIIKHVVVEGALTFLISLIGALLLYIALMN